MADYYCENCEFFEDRSTDKLIDGFCKKYNQPLNFYDWWEKCDRCIIDTLQTENAALRERLEKAVELPTERKVDDFYMEPYFGEIKMPLYDDDKAKVVIPMYVYFKFNSIGEAKQWLKEQQEK